ncbi:YceI family protein [Aureispira sp. CCB-QB1]|uniref:YceI family protein n=1 Tax=Aureispira sp. CCB-QB1 TaxID=1313421 RepID=UPI000696F902|nr:YceI family protein [Aureispira sp. CCB-QB1]
MKQLVLLVIALLFAQSNIAQIIDTKASKIEFEVSNMGKIVKGTMLNLKGTVNFDANNLEASSFEATADPATVNTESKGRDKHLQKDDFFGVATYPTVKISSDKISKTEEGYEAEATLTIRDISTKITIPFTVEEKENRQHLTGTFTIQRKEYGLGEKMGAGSIGLDVTVYIDCFVQLK